MLGEYKCLRLLPSFSLSSSSRALRFLSHTVNTTHHQSAFLVCSQELSMHIRCCFLHLIRSSSMSSIASPRGNWRGAAVQVVVLPIHYMLR